MVHAEEYTVISRRRVNFMYHMINSLQSSLDIVLELYPSIVEEHDILEDVGAILSQMAKDIDILSTDIEEIVDMVGEIPQAIESPEEFVEDYIFRKQMIRGFQLKAKIENYQRLHTSPWGWTAGDFDNQFFATSSGTHVDPLPPQYVHHVDDKKAVKVTPPSVKQIQTKKQKPSFSLGGFEVVRGTSK